ncbi:hypothetical protein AB3N58_00905 [Leptospira sp. WS60.C2]
MNTIRATSIPLYAKKSQCDDWIFVTYLVASDLKSFDEFKLIKNNYVLLD